jgi:hypothetical protein
VDRMTNNEPSPKRVSPVLPATPLEETPVAPPAAPPIESAPAPAGDFLDFDTLPLPGSKRVKQRKPSKRPVMLIAVVGGALAVALALFFFRDRLGLTAAGAPDTTASRSDRAKAQGPTAADAPSAAPTAVKDDDTRPLPQAGNLSNGTPPEQTHPDNGRRTPAARPGNHRTAGRPTRVAKTSDSSPSHGEDEQSGEPKSDEDLAKEAMKARRAFLTGELATSPAPVVQRRSSLPVPDADAQSAALKAVKEVYGEQWTRAKTPAEKQALAKTLLDQSRQNEKNPAAQFVLLRVARDVATQALDGQTAFAVIDEIDSCFEVDALEMKLAVLKKATSAASVPTVSAAVIKDQRTQHGMVSKIAADLAERAVAKENYPIAKELAALALGEARKIRESTLVKELSERAARIDQLEKEHEAVKAAMAALEKSPDDPAASLAVGKYKCLVKGDWDGGLPLLARSSDDEFKGLAAQERSTSSPDEQVKLADRWWNLAETQEGTTKRPIQGRAAYWYRKALPGLSGLAKAKAEKRIDEAAGR